MDERKLIERYKSRMEMGIFHLKLDDKPYFVSLFDFMNKEGVIGKEIKLSGPIELLDLCEKLEVKC